MTLSRAITASGMVIVVTATGLQAGRGEITNPATAGQPVIRVETAASDDMPAAARRALLDRYCVTCHNERLRTGGLALDTVDVEDIPGNAEVWERVIRKLRAGLMPPAGRRRPDKATGDAFVASLESVIDRAAAAAPNPGWKGVHRLNRAEYANAIRDLLALEIDVEALLPADEAGYGFDNSADVLRLSPGLLERYLLAANKISRSVLGDSTVSPAVRRYVPPPLFSQEDRVSDDLPMGSRGGVVIAHYFPVDADYVIKIQLQRVAFGVGDRIRGLGEVNEIDVRVDGVRVKLFTLGGDAKAGDSIRMSWAGADTRDSDLEVRVPIKAGQHLVGVAFRKRTWVPEGVGPGRLPIASWSFNVVADSGGEFGRIESGVASLEIKGPYNPRAPQEAPSRQRILSCTPVNSGEEERCARAIVSALARRAYRRPLTEEDIETLLDAYRTGRSEGGFEGGVRRTLETILVAPEFLFRIESDRAGVEPGAVYAITDVELASRLSFFLWSSIPDDELLDVAARGELKDMAVLERQVRRMLGDPRAKALVENFFGQWLYVRNMSAVKPDTRVFPDFDDNLRWAFQHETELFLTRQLSEDRSVAELLTSNSTFVNERLARHYGIPNVYGPHFRSVTFSDDRRAGILGQGSILTVTSYGHRTSPVLRGKWMLDNLLGSPPPEPPPNVPELKENEEGAALGTVRERMEQHRKNPACSSCHAQMDPLGFALENFDAIGRWRVTDAGIPIDASGTFPDGTKFDGPAGFRKALLDRYRQQFIRTVNERLLTYALGRGVEHYDQPAIRTIMRDAASSDFRWSSVIIGIIKSRPFRMRKAEP